MKKLKLVFVALLFLTLFSSSAYSGNKRPIYKIGSYYEFIMSFDITTVRFSGKVISITDSGNIRYQVLRIYNEPAMGDYNQYYFYDTIANILYSKDGYTFGCLDSDMKQKVVGFDWPKGYIFNTCFDTMGGSFRRSIISDTGTFYNIFNTGFPLRALERKDTTGSPVNIMRRSSYSEMFGFLGFYQNTGAPFGSGWYSIELAGAIIDSVRYGSILLGVEQTSSEIPDKFTLKQNYPNPFNSSTLIEFSLQKTTNARLKIFDMLGREISLLFDERKPPGSYKYHFDSGILTSGIYFYRLETDYGILSRRMMIIK